MGSLPRNTHTHTYAPIKKQTDAHTDRQTDIRTQDRQTDAHIDGQTDAQDVVQPIRIAPRADGGGEERVREDARDGGQAGGRARPPPARPAEREPPLAGDVHQAPECLHDLHDVVRRF